MKKKTAYAVFTFTDSGLDHMVKGNFGDNKEAAGRWVTEQLNELSYVQFVAKYPNGLFVKEVKY